MKGLIYIPFHLPVALFLLLITKTDTKERDKQLVKKIGIDLIIFYRQLLVNNFPGMLYAVFTDMPFLAGDQYFHLVATAAAE